MRSTNKFAAATLCFLASNGPLRAEDVTDISLLCTVYTEGGNKPDIHPIIISETRGIAIVDQKFTYEIRETNPRFELGMTGDMALQQKPETNCSGAVCLGEILLIDRATGEIDWIDFSSKNSAPGLCEVSNGKPKF